MSNQSKSKSTQQKSQSASVPESTSTQTPNTITKDSTIKSTPPSQPPSNGTHNSNHNINNNTDEKSMYDDEEDIMQIQLNGFNNSNNSNDSNEYKNNKKESKPARNPIELSINLDTISNKYLRETQEIYYTQCPSLRAAEAKQLALFKVAAIGRKNNNFPLLLNLIDCYLRDKFNYFLSNPKAESSITEQEWCKNYKTVKKLTSTINKDKDKERLKDIIEAAIRTYFRRYCQPLLLPTPYQIRDSIPKFIQCIHEIGGLILAIKQNPIEILPFQIDLVIIPQDVVDIANVESDDDDSDEFDDDDSDDDSDDSSADYDSDDAPKPFTNKNSAEIGNIELRLKENNIVYQHDTKPAMEREFRNLYRKYTQSVTSPTIKIKNIKNNMSAVDNIGADLQRFPHGKRLVIVVDRRKKKEDNNNNNSDNNNSDNDNKDEEKNEIYLFEPPEMNTMPNNHIREWYIESSYKCIIPGYKKAGITSKSSLDGWINVFSFHVEQEDEIKCYFYRGGQILRFMPKDIKNLFQHLFDLNCKKYPNKGFINGHQIEKDIQRMNNTWKDIHFNKFREMLC